MAKSFFSDTSSEIFCVQVWGTEQATSKRSVGTTSYTLIFILLTYYLNTKSTKSTQYLWVKEYVPESNNEQ